MGVTTDLKQLSSHIQQFFLHEMVVSPPTLVERQDMITGLSRYIPMETEVDICDLAQSTAGFVLGDFITLFSNAKRLAVNDLLQ